LCLCTEEGFLNLAGALMFARHPEMIAPQYVIKAAHFVGNHVYATEYYDSEDFGGPLGTVFKGAKAFIMRNMRKVQAGRGFNYPGTPEIDPAVFVELLVNSLVHRDYLISAPIRLFIFDDRIEIISPGSLPGHLTVDNVLNGISTIRNPVIASYVAKGILPYQGLGTGIRRALAKWPNIDFIHDRELRQFTCRIHRPPVVVPQS
jgi:ATP-dependent DNA helicase RecG